MKKSFKVILIKGMLFFICFNITLYVATAFSQDDCLLCHSEYAKGKFVHEAVNMGCQTCHVGIDPKEIPHKITGKIAKGLSSEIPDICYNCHDKGEFKRKNIHMPVAGGMCLGCHNPHKSEEFALLKKKPNMVCYDCHANIKNKPHAVSGFGSGHFLGDTKVVSDPARPGKTFYCGSCHNPHSSDSPKLFRYPGHSEMDICTKCHKY